MFVQFVIECTEARAAWSTMSQTACQLALYDNGACICSNGIYEQHTVQSIAG